MIDVVTEHARLRRRARLLLALMAVAVPAWAVLVYVAATGFIWLMTHEFFPAHAARVVAILWNWEPMVLVAGGLLAVVLVTAAVSGRSYRRGGGGAVAAMLGGEPIDPATADPAERRVREVVEQVARAALTTAPPVYVLADERGINALGAGVNRDDAVIVVTRGAIDHLDHDELRGVVAHELCHVLSGDTRVNLHLRAMSDAMMVGVAIVFVPLIGMMIYDWAHRRLSRPAAGCTLMVVCMSAICVTAPLFLLIVPAFVLTMPVAVPGYYLGRWLLYGRLVHWRETVTDAAAVELTRDAAGLARALKKIGGHWQRGRLSHGSAAEVAHMLFVPGVAGGSRGPKAYRPSEARIRRLEENWDGRYLEPEQAVTR